MFLAGGESKTSSIFKSAKMELIEPVGSISPKSEIPLDPKSPQAGSHLSKEDTSSSKESTPDVHTDEPVRNSWRAGIANFWRQSNVSIDVPQSQVDTDKTEAAGDGNDEVKDSSLPIAERTSRRASEAPDDPVELPASPISAPGISRSFFDTDSESDEEGAVSPTIPVITRASSVRIQRPVLVQHRSADNTRLLHRLMDSGIRLAQPSMTKAEQILGQPLGSVSYETSGLESTRSLPVQQTIIDHLDRNRDILQATPESYQAEFDTVPTTGASAILKPEEQQPPTRSTTAMAAAPPSPDLSFTPSSIIEVPSTPLRREALDTLPSPMGGLGVLRAPSMHPGRLGGLAIDGLRSNPLSSEEVNKANKLHRALSAPPLPSKRVKDLRRKVTIRPLDTITANQLNNGHHNMLKESVVSTPYPSRATSLDEPHITRGIESAKPGGPVLPGVAEAPEDSQKAPMRDRFPSVVTNEVLRIEVSIARHPLDALTIEIPVEDRSTFDDKELFTQLRASYYQMIGVRRRCLPRKISFVSCSCTKAVQNFSPRDFMSHFRTPEIGHKRKTWLLWLRSTQPKNVSHLQATPLERAISAAPGSPDSQICDFTLQTTPNTAMTVLNNPATPKDTSPIQTQSVVNGTFLASPSTLMSPDKEKPNETTAQSGAEDIEANHASNVIADMESIPRRWTGLPVFTFHHSHSIHLLLLALALTCLLSATATIFWILFGVPGKSAASGNTHGGRRQMGWRWQEDAQRRVLVGFVFGIAVFLAGTIFSGFWLLFGEISL